MFRPASMNRAKKKIYHVRIWLKAKVMLNYLMNTFFFFLLITCWILPWLLKIYKLYVINMFESSFFLSYHKEAYHLLALWGTETPTQGSIANSDHSTSGSFPWTSSETRQSYTFQTSVALQQATRLFDTFLVLLWKNMLIEAYTDTNKLKINNKKIY